MFLLVGLLIAIFVGLSVFFQSLWVLKLAEKICPSVTWFGPRPDKKIKKIYLTIDDAPSGRFSTEILDTLHQNGAHATFFCIGSYANAHTEAMKRVVTEGHGLGNHTMFDRASVKLPLPTLRAEIAEVEQIIDAAYNKEKIQRPTSIKWFRPGSGFFSSSLLSETKKVRLSVL